MRLNSLDYLRGMAAVGIMLFHFFSNTYGEYNSQFVLSRFGLYGVSIFYILSGLTLAHVYGDKLNDKSSVITFFLKRIARILPLLWLTTTLTIIGSRQHFSLDKIILNYTGLFGFISPSLYITGGAWSIGNEMVFYVFFPIFLFFFRKNVMFFHLFALLALAANVYFAFTALSNGASIIKQWEIYINPFNQIIFFIAGMYMGLYKDSINFNKPILVTLFIISVGVFVFYPVAGNPINLVSGSTRIVFITDCVLMTLVIFKLNAIPNLFLHQTLKWFGDVSYSLYLIHPIIWAIIPSILSRISFLNGSSFLSIPIAVVLTLAVSGLIYKFFEVPIIKMVNKKLVIAK